MVCTPEQTVLTGAAILNVFVRHADRTNRKRARLKYLLDERGLEWFVDQTQSELQSMEAGFSLKPCPIAFDAPRTPVKRMAHIGSHPQRETEKRYVGLALEMGRLSTQQMRALGNLAIEYGTNELRLTVWQNVLLPHVANTDEAALINALADAGLSCEATAFAAGAVACTGKTACKLGLAHTKEDGLALVRHLEQKFTMTEPINIHLTGCPNSCAQHYIGDIGLVGVTLADGGEGYYLVLGGGSDQDKGIGRLASGPMPVDQVNGVVEQIVARYFSERESDENFLSYIRRIPDEVLPTLVDTGSLDARPVNIEALAV